MKTPRLVSLCFGILTLATLLHAEPPASPSKEDGLTEKMNALQQAVSDLRGENFPLAKAKPESLEKELARLMKLPVEEIHTLVENCLQSTDSLMQAQALLGHADFPKADESFDKVLADKDADPKRLRTAHFGMGLIAYINLDYDSGQKHYQSGLSLIDKDKEPLAWAKCAERVCYCYLMKEQFKKAEPLLREILRLHEENQGQPDANVAEALNNLSVVLQMTDRWEEAEPLMRRSLGIVEARLGKDDPKLGVLNVNLAQVLMTMGRFEEAEELLRRALVIDESSLGKDHPNVATVLATYAVLLEDLNRPTEAERLLRRALAIYENSFGKNHPNLATLLLNLAMLLGSTEREEEAEPIMKRALQISEDTFGKEHPKTLKYRKHYKILQQKIGQ